MSQFGKQRGNKLWEGSRMIIPEHRAYMVEREIYQESFVERPALDEHTLEEMQRTVQEAMTGGLLLTLQIYQDGNIQEVAMVPKWLDRDRLKGYEMDGNLRSVEFGDIVGVES